MARKLGVSRVLLVSAFLLVECAAQLVKDPPPTRTDNVVDTVHNVAIVDPYRWLEDQNSPETRAWLEAQTGYTRSILDSLPGRDNIKRRIKELSRIDVVGTPAARGGRYFFLKRASDQNLFVIYVRDGIDGKDEVLIDPHPMSPDNTVSVGLMSVSNDGNLVAYGIREGGADEVAVRFMEVDTRMELSDRLPRARYFGVSLLPDKSGFYYSRMDKEGPRIYFHSMGSNPAADTEVFGSGYGPDKIATAGVSQDGKYLLINVYHGAAALKTEVYIQDLMAKGPITPIVNDVDARFSPALGGDLLFLQTNWEAPNNRIFQVDLKEPDRSKWRLVIPEGKAVISGYTLAGGKICVNYLENVHSKVKIFEPNGTYTREISFPTIGTVSSISGRWESDEAFFAFTSYHIPTTIYRYDVKRDTREQWSRLSVPVNTEEFEVSQVWYESKDGTKVPMFLVQKRGLKLDGTNPVYLNGYGGFNISMTPGFSSTSAFWLERGGVFAIPNLRGGGEFGEAWHRAGMFEKKQNVFDDFIAAAEWLIKNGYTNPSKLVIAGGSNGGLLVGAALTQRPELFRSVVCTVPLLDMVRYHKFLVAQFWVSEYGSAEDPKQFKYIYEYSPYHRVKPGVKYPAVLLMSGDLDTRVDPLHARKMAALLQSTMTPDRPVLLHYHTKAGHSGGRPLDLIIEDATDQMSFLIWQLGISTGG